MVMFRFETFPLTTAVPSGIVRNAKRIQTCRRVRRALMFASLGLEDADLSAFLFVRGQRKEVFQMPWFFLIIAGLLEVAWSTCLKFSNGLTNVKFTIFTIVGMILSFLCLAQATKTLPLGTSYAIWTGIGALGAVIAGIILFHEAVTPLRLLFVALLIAGIVGLEITSE